MIIRELKYNENLIKKFDYFNDYKDTRRWLEYNQASELIVKLDSGYTKWLKELNKKDTIRYE